MPAEASARPADWLVPPWADDGVGAVMSTRCGGVSEGRFERMNLRHGLGDTPQAVDRNLALFTRAIGAAPVWLQQVHGARVVRIAAPDALPGAPVHEADASVTTEPGVACCVQVADCLPLLLAAPRARGVAAAHAGWRGLALGVVEATVQALCEAACCEPGQLQVWLGPSIGPRRFEVGADVLRAFGADPTRQDQPHFRSHLPGKWMADLCGLARDRLQRAGVSRISGGDWCTVEDASRFFSFRRDGVTGRMAAAVWLHRRG